MKFNKFFIAAMACAVVFTSCKKDENKDNGEEGTPEKTGSFQLKFDNFFGSSDMKLKSGYDTTSFDFTTHKGQSLNITKCGYYVTNVKLEGPSGEVHLDPVVSSALASEVKGFYHIQESVPASQGVVLSGIPEGEYNKVSFNIGIPESAVTEGAQGGILDVAEGAWFWSWNSGYIGLKLEGTSNSSGQEVGVDVNKYDVELHVGGWKDIGAMVNNVKTVTLDLPEEIDVKEGLTPKAHIVVDFKMLLMMADVDFSTTYAVHSPAAGQELAEHIPHIFSVEHVHAH